MRDIVAGIIITGGSGGPGVELLRGDGTTCTLPSLPEARTYHTQAGLVACGGYGTLTSCVTFSAGTWVYTHQLETFRYDHVSWSSPEGVVLMGGAGAYQASELLSDNSEDSTIHFPLKHRTL